MSGDGHITFDNAYYSVPFCVPKGTKVRVRGSAQFVTLFSLAHEALATHDRAHKAGERRTHPDHLPPHKAAGLALNRDALSRGRGGHRRRHQPNRDDLVG